jgi:hypothetical protein
VVLLIDDDFVELVVELERRALELELHRGKGAVVSVALHANFIDCGGGHRLRLRGGAGGGLRDNGRDQCKRAADADGPCNEPS